VFALRQTGGLRWPVISKLRFRLNQSLYGTLDYTLPAVVSPTGKRRRAIQTGMGRPPLNLTGAG
jgi:hypothetical protein